MTKVGARRPADGSWLHAHSRQEIIDAVHDNLRNLGLDSIQVVNLRLGGFTPLQSSELDALAVSAGSTPMQIALAWLLHRSPNILLIPGTSSVEHLRENLQAASLGIPPEVIRDLDSIGGSQAR